jgi:hypothetical protein
MPAAGLFLLALLQAEIPTVGDTVWATRTLTVPVGAVVRPRPVPASAALEPLGPPQVVLRAADVLVRYPLVAWRPGVHSVELPGPILVRPDGWSDTLPAARVRIEIASVLPADRPDTLPPRPAQAAIPRRTRTASPAAILVVLVGLALLPLHWWWRRRGFAMAGPAPGSAGPSRLDPARLAAWAERGERRAALDGWTALLETRAQEAGRDELLERIHAARYAPAPEGAVTVLAEARAWWAGAGNRS